MLEELATDLPLDSRPFPEALNGVAVTEPAQ